jgi:hypothetical protein
VALAAALVRPQVRTVAADAAVGLPPDGSTVGATVDPSLPQHDWAPDPFSSLSSDGSSGGGCRRRNRSSRSSTSSSNATTLTTDQDMGSSP